MNLKEIIAYVGNISEDEFCRGELSIENKCCVIGHIHKYLNLSHPGKTLLHLWQIGVNPVGLSKANDLSWISPKQASLIYLKSLL